MDYNEEGRAGAAVIVLLGLKVYAQGSKGDGTLAWCTMETPKGRVNVALVYVPNGRAKSSQL